MIQLFRPYVLSIAVELAKVKISTILASVSIYEVTITMARSVMPLTSILRDLVTLNLDAIAVSDSQDFRGELRVDLADVFNDQGLNTFLVKDSERVILCSELETDSGSMSAIWWLCACSVAPAGVVTSFRMSFRLFGLFSLAEAGKVFWLNGWMEDLYALAVVDGTIGRF